ncbi:MAG: phage tail protein [Polaribacter sp.]|uniref:phage tail protein n=1 Tax=Polaribacter sp. TaxID=1920175 RepID=UPI002F35F293
MKFYRNQVEIRDVTVDNKTQLKQSLQGQDIIQCNFTLDSFFDFQIGDYVEWRNKKYTIFKQPSVKKDKTNVFQYNFDIESDQYRLLDALYMLDGQTDFYLMGDLEKFANLIVVNLNRLSGTGFYQLGSIPNTDVRNLSFQDQTCLNVLQKISQEFSFEFLFSDDGRTISFIDKIGNDIGLSFEFKKGLRNIERQKVNDKNIITNLYAFGGERNISKDYGSKKLKIDVLEKNVDLFGKIEGVVNFDEIYPHREGTVSTVISDNLLKFTDTSLDFDVNSQLIEGTVAKVTFNSGYLAGYELEISDYVHSSKTFTIIAYSDVNGLEFPNDTLKIRPGDKYVLHDIIMPEIYVTNAETELEEKSQDYLDENSLPNVIYNIVPDYVYLRKNLIQLKVGDVIEVKDTDLNVVFNTRIIDVVQSLSNKYVYSIKVGNKVNVGYISQVRNNLTALDNNIRIERQDRTIQYNRIRRNLKNIDELRDSIFDPDGYFETDKIKPLSIETGMLSVGMKGQQFITRNLLIEANFQGNTNRIKCGEGQLVHFIIDPNGVKEWNLTGNIFDLSNSNTFYYIYAKCSKATNTGVYEISTNQIQTDSGIYYYFLIGVIHSVIDNVRGISLTYGQTTINGKFITTGRVQSIDGYNFFDLDSNQMNLGDGLSGMDWNVSNPNKLTIRGGLVQSPSGSTNPITVYKGDWKVNEIYFYGDEVTHNGSTFIYINTTQTQGNSPIHRDYWVASAQSGNTIRTIYRRYVDNFVNDGFTVVGFIDNIYIPEGLNPADWSEEPTQGDGPLWMSKAIVDIYDEIIEGWSNPVRLTGRNGVSGPGIVYRGIFDETKQYFNNEKRRDAVKYSGNYYLYNGTNDVALVWSNSNWEDFGAQFDSVATNTLLAENANIGDWKIKDGKITSQNEHNGSPRAQFDGANGKITLRSPKEIYNTDSTTSIIEQIIQIDSIEGQLKSTHEGTLNQEPGETIVDSEGLSVKFAGINVEDTEAIDLKAGVSANVKGKMNSLGFGSQNPLVGVYGRALNTDIDPTKAFGGYFYDLMAKGLFLHGAVRQNLSYYIPENEVFVTMSGASASTVYLPYNDKGHNTYRLLFIKAQVSTVTVDANNGVISTTTNVSTISLSQGQVGLFYNIGINSWSFSRLTF